MHLFVTSAFCPLAAATGLEYPPAREGATAARVVVTAGLERTGRAAAQTIDPRPIATFQSRNRKLKRIIVCSVLFEIRIQFLAVTLRVYLEDDFLSQCLLCRQVLLRLQLLQLQLLRLQSKRGPQENA
jgi:hypothetical protein